MYLQVVKCKKTYSSRNIYINFILMGINYAGIAWCDTQVAQTDVYAGDCTCNEDGYTRQDYKQLGVIPLTLLCTVFTSQCILMLRDGPLEK